MSIRVMSTVWEESKAKGGDLLVLLALADFAHDNGIAFPSVQTLAKKARLTDRQTQSIIRKLVDRGELTVRINAGPHGTNLYRVIAARKGEDEKASPLVEDAEQGVKSASGGDEARTPAGVKSASPEPSLTRQGEGETPGDVVAHITKAQRDSVWSALAHETETYPETISERSLFGKCVKELALAGADPGEIAVRAERYRKKYPGAALTPRALVNHWGSLSRPVSGRRGKMSADDIRQMGR